jgi:hypothetical protein
MAGGCQDHWNYVSETTFTETHRVYFLHEKKTGIETNWVLR